MNPSTHLILVSAQPIPNITPILDDAVKPQHVIMLVSTDMQEKANALQTIYQTRGIRVQQHPIADPWNANQISDTIIDILSQYDDGQIALNATGGTKLMSIAAYEAFRMCEAPIYYVHPEQDQLLWLSPKQPHHPIAGRITLKDYLTAYGAQQLHIPNPFGVPAHLRQLTANLITHIDRYADELSTLNYLAYKADNPTLSVHIEQGPQSKPLLWELIEQFEQAGLCRINGHQLHFTNAENRFITNGGWLELHAHAACLNLKTALNIQDLACNVTIQRQQGKTTLKNEIDIGLIKANRLHIIECKTKQIEKDADLLYKLDSLRDLMGGLQGKAMLVSFNSLDKASRARAKELKINLCCKTELRTLQQHLQHWLTTG